MWTKEMFSDIDLIWPIFINKFISYIKAMLPDFVAIIIDEQRLPMLF